MNGSCPERQLASESAARAGGTVDGASAAQTVGRSVLPDIELRKLRPRRPGKAPSYSYRGLQGNGMVGGHLGIGIPTQRRYSHPRSRKAARLTPGGAYQPFAE